MIIICVYACFNTYLLFPDFNDILSIAYTTVSVSAEHIFRGESVAKKVITDILPVVLVIIIAGVIFVILFF